MDQSGNQGTDGSSIKPVSSLRSHFEQMGKSNLKPIPSPSPLRPTSPKPTIDNLNIVAPSPLLLENTSRINNSLEAKDALIPQRVQEAHNAELKTPRSPAVKVEPPSSPPKSMNNELGVALPMASLRLEGPRPYLEPNSTPSRHNGSPNQHPRSSIEAQRSPPSPRPHPPEPPPPRRSGEHRRDPLSNKMSPSTQINRAEKPKIPEKAFHLSGDMSAATLTPNLVSNTRLSPFNTPPSSGSSPEPDTYMIPVAQSKLSDSQAKISRQQQSSTANMPIHTTFVSKESDSMFPDHHEVITATQVAKEDPEKRPTLPARPGTMLSSRTVYSNQRNLDQRHPDDGKQLSRAQESSKGFATPPKRIHSTPTSFQPPPRTHGRSMTVTERASERITANQNSMAVDDGAPSVGFTSVNPAAIEYPDLSRSNRRPPYLKQSVKEIPTKSDTRLFDVSGDFICVTGLYTRVWSMTSGNQILSIAHGETIRMMSVSFKAARDPKEEGTKLWLGSNLGELLELDIATQEFVASFSGAHTRREIIKIYRYAKQMWTLDDGGALLVWTPDSSGSPNLNSSNQMFRVPKGHTFSLVAGGKLWYATGKEIRIFEPSFDGETQFLVLMRPLTQLGAGDVTAGSLLPAQPSRVYFGHSDGKVSIYSRDDYSCIGILNISIYKINSLAAASHYLWAGYNTGMIYVYDTSISPWVVKKDWRAHENPVIRIITNQSIAWNSEQQAVVSLGADNVLRSWDGLLEEDWLEAELQSQDHKFCTFEQISTLVVTWNAGASTPHSLRYAEQDASFFRNLLQAGDPPDILVVGFQELVDLEDKAATAKSFFKSKRKDKKDSYEQEHMSHQYRDWRDYLIRCLDDYMPQNELYHLLHTANLVGLFTCIFVRAHLRDRITNLGASEVKRGMGGRHGNKGALITRFRLDDTSLCFINCHLAAGQTSTKDRNFDVSEILESTSLPAERDRSMRFDSYVGGGDGTMILDHEMCVLNGDLNYRIDTMGRDAVVNTIKAGNLPKLLERDQLLVSKRKNAAFRLRAFHELPIKFNPTYKYDVGTDNYDTSEKRRAPAWCDRILYRGRSHSERIKQLDYRRHEVRVSDHRPVTALFQMTIKKIQPRKRAAVWEQCLTRFEETKREQLEVSKHSFLHDVYGIGAG